MILTEEEKLFLQRLHNRASYYEQIYFPIMASDYARAATLIERLTNQLEEQSKNNSNEKIESEKVNESTVEDV